MAEAFIYMYVVGAGTAAGVATVAFIGWKVWNRQSKKKVKQQRKAAF
ncbi:hypothetical protein ACQCT6_02790 [Cytobacillus gottheilii]|nr:hypothetical protein [Cytobacillus gottheilii]